MKTIDLYGMNRDELTDLLAAVMIRLRHIEAEEIKQNFVTKSQRLRMHETVQEHLRQTPKVES
jgi:hypothetical protein